MHRAGSVPWAIGAMSLPSFSVCGSDENSIRNSSRVANLMSLRNTDPIIRCVFEEIQALWGELDREWYKYLMNH